MSQYAFKNYGELKATIADWLIRPDLDDRIPQFVKLAEEFCNSNLRTREMIKRSRTRANERYISLPADWRKAKNVQRVADNYPLGLMTLDEMDHYRLDVANGRIHPGDSGPQFFSLIGETMEFAPSPSADNPHDIEMIYYSAVPPLDNDLDSNWVLRKYPSILLYGALVHSAPFLKDDDRLAVWEGMLQTAVSSANISDSDARFSGAPLVRRIKGFGG